VGCTRGGADGLHAGSADDWVGLRGQLRDGRILGVGGLKTRDEAMRAGEAGVDYLMFGEPRPDGYLPPFDEILDRAEWWAEIFETPCVVFAPTLDDVASAAETGTEFVALGDAVWMHPAGAAAAVRAARPG
jgi:thiamine-phosphate pyrophosphorylase